MNLVLASASPRRRELLAQAGFTFTVQPAHIPEDPLPNEDPVAYVVRLARQKAEAVFAQLTCPSARPAQAPVLYQGTTSVVPHSPQEERRAPPQVARDSEPQSAQAQLAPPQVVLGAPGLEFETGVGSHLANDPLDNLIALGADTTAPPQMARDPEPQSAQAQLAPPQVARDSESQSAQAQLAPPQVVLGADTTVTIDNLILAKPENPADAARMLRLLSGRTHRVITGVAIVTAHHTEVAAEVTGVRFLTLSEEEIADYIATGEPMDKAGAYGIQGHAARWIPRITGDYFNVVGLPISLVSTMLRQAESRKS